MFFFRAVIHLLIRSKIYQYIAYQRMAGNQLIKFLPVQRYFSPWKWKYNLHTTEFVFPITVKVTEPLRFFFCRFLLESAAGLFLVCVAAPRLSIWIFTFQKFRLEVLAVKYAPRKVYIKESGGYVELSYTDFCRRRQADKSLSSISHGGRAYLENRPAENAGVFHKGDCPTCAFDDCRASSKVMSEKVTSFALCLRSSLWVSQASLCNTVLQNFWKAHCL